MPYADKKKQRKAQAKWARENRTANRNGGRSRRHKWFIEYTEKQECRRCGLSFKGHPEWCDYHHIDPLFKTGFVGEICQGYSMTRLKAELCFTIPLCALCHRSLHVEVS